MNENWKFDPDRVSFLADFYELKHPSVPELVKDDDIIKMQWRLVYIGFDAADKKWIASEKIE